MRSFPLTPSDRPLDGRLVNRVVIIPKKAEVSFPCSYRSTCSSWLYFLKENNSFTIFRFVTISMMISSLTLFPPHYVPPSQFMTFLTLYICHKIECPFSPFGFLPPCLSYIQCVQEILCFSKNFHYFVTSPSLALGCYGLCIKLTKLVSQ